MKRPDISRMPGRLLFQGRWRLSGEDRVDDAVYVKGVAGQEPNRVRIVVVRIRIDVQMALVAARIVWMKVRHRRHGMARDTRC